MEIFHNPLKEYFLLIWWSFFLDDFDKIPPKLPSFYEIIDADLKKLEATGLKKQLLESIKSLINKKYDDEKLLSDDLEKLTLSKREKKTILKNAKKNKDKNYETEYKDIEISPNDEKFKHNLKILEDSCKDEIERRQIIENKAHSMFTQVGQTATLLTICISLFTVNSSFLPLIIKIIIWTIFVILFFNLITTGLWARKVVALNYLYPNVSLKFNKLTSCQTDKAENDSWLKEYIIEKLYIKDRLSYYNNIKGSCLKFSHFYYKVTFIIILILVMVLPPIFIFSYKPPDNQKDNQILVLQKELTKINIAVESLQKAISVLEDKNSKLTEQINSLKVPLQQPKIK